MNDLITSIVARIQDNALLVVPVAIICLNLLATIIVEQRQRRKLGILPAYVTWLEAKAEDYENALLFYASTTDNGECARSALAAYGHQPEEGR